MDLTSPEHDAIVARAITNRRAAHAAGLRPSEKIRCDWILDEIRACLLDTDRLRYRVEQAAPDSTLHYLSDRWRECGSIVDYGSDVEALRASAATRNEINAQAGRADLADRLAADAAGRAAA